MKETITLGDHLNNAIRELELAIDTFPDKDADIRRDNRQIEGVLEVLKAINMYYEDRN